MKDVKNSKVPILFFANKSDLPAAHPASKIQQQMELNELEGHDWFIQPCDAIQGKGV